MISSGFFSFFINHLQNLENKRENLNQIDGYLSILDEYLYFDILENIEKFYSFNKAIDNILVFIDESEISKCQLLILSDLFPNTNKIAICTGNNDLNIMNLCDELNFSYYNKQVEYLESNLNEKEFMIRYCKLCNINYCFMNIDNNELISIIFDGFFNNDYREDINSIEEHEEDDIHIYNFFSNVKIYLSYINLWDHYFGNLGNNYIDNYYYHQDLINDNWRTNLILTYNQLKKDDSNLSTKINNLFDDFKFKYGAIIKLDNDNLPYWLWENIFSQYCDDFNLDIEKHVIQTLYFTITENKKDDGEILQDWRYNYNNGVFVLYNFTKLQEFIYKCEYDDTNDFELNNNLELFLDGNIMYEVLEHSEDEYLNFHELNLNLEDTNNEEVFYNFNFKKFKPNSIVKTVS
tara:strand:- start:4261 stop:5478 length:1218 start_codon:yes stop_codon:yes gene_type:complete